MLDGIQRSGNLPILLPEAGTVAEIEVGYLPLKVLPLSKEERKRYWNKTVVEFDGEVTLAELVIRRLAERQGFDAVWVTGADRFTKTWPRKPVELPPVSRHWYARVARGERVEQESVRKRQQGQMLGYSRMSGR